MLKQNISYTNYDDQPVTETFYFHLSQVELLRWEAELQHSGGVSALFKETMESNDGGKIMAFMEDLIARSYGEKTPNGNQHLKSEEILNNFKNSAAYDAFFMSLVTDPQNAANFMNGIVPKELAENVEKMSKLDQVKAAVDARQGVQSEPKPAAPPEEVAQPQPTEPVSDPAQGGNVFHPNARVLTRAELMAMDDAELRTGLAEGRFIIGNE